MADIIFVLIAVAFFGLCVLYVRACDRLVRKSEDTPEAASEVGEVGNVVEVTR